jgi:hypothetical protein
MPRRETTSSLRREGSAESPGIRMPPEEVLACPNVRWPDGSLHPLD